MIFKNSLLASWPVRDTASWFVGELSYKQTWQVGFLLHWWLQINRLKRVRLKTDGTTGQDGVSLPQLEDHIVALMTRRGRRRDSNYCPLMKA